MITFGTTWLDDLIRRRRADRRAEVFDSLATLMACGMTLDASMSVLVGDKGVRSSTTTLLQEVHSSLHEGQSLAEAAARLPRWFDPVDVAMLRASERSGQLATGLATLARRQRERLDVRQRLAAALAYPVTVLTVTLIVFIAMSRTTLPPICDLLIRARVEVPALTNVMVAIGDGLPHAISHAPIVGIVTALTAGFLILARPAIVGRVLGIRPLLARRMAVAILAVRLAELLRHGVPLLEALRVLAPTSSLPLQRVVLGIIEGLTAGQDFPSAFDEPRWFTPEFRRLLGVAQASGTLPETLDQLGRRDIRSIHRRIDRLIAAIEPLAIAFLATIVGILAMASILPLIRLQETLR